MTFEVRAFHPSDPGKPPILIDLNRPDQVAQHIMLGSRFERREVGEWEPMNLEPHGEATQSSSAVEPK